MIQTVLSFILGFLVAAALALAVAPALWRRAGVLARKRIEASMPLSREELQAEIDAVRAGYAMTTRRLEMKAEAIKKKAAQDLVEINVQREEARRLGEECAARDEALAALQARHDDIARQLSEREAGMKALSAKLPAAERSLAERTAEVEELSRLYEESSLIASSHQVELVAREADIERLNDTITRLRNEAREADRARRAAASEKTKVEEALNVARKRSEELERKLERMMTNLSTRDERLERQEKEIARLKRKIREAAGGDDGRSSLLVDAEEAKARLEMQVADLSLQISTLLAQEGGEGGEMSTARKSEVERLQSRLAALMRENKKLRAAIAAADEGPGDDALREQISSLAAEVVNMAAALEGPGSPIEKALSELPPAPPEDEIRPPSLADRVRTLREGSAPAE
ncbi:hypothetical protein [Chelativorans xinjiangense]|uniref:hypothetical protein n=1 Tax=Chelativorans xinjiangense TaxID=2681485 RepID=UPI00135CECE1|nr:hypothetical protein [Chelativorans xinjiangense]